MFSTAGRSVKSGLVAAAVVSSWTWAATLLQSSAVAYKYGISGPFFYASGCPHVSLKKENEMVLMVPLDYQVQPFKSSFSQHLLLN